ncbi:hypothetical protein PGB90_000408 [Kerria lacca]
METITKYDKNYREKYYELSQQRNIVDEPKILNIRKSFHYQDSRTVDPSISNEIDHSFHTSIFPSEYVFLKQQLTQGKNNTETNISEPSQWNLESFHRVERDIDHDNIDLIEPKNDIEMETKQLGNDAILETAHQISGYNYYNQIKPTKTRFLSDLNDDISKSDMILLTNSGEENRASSRGRSLPLVKPGIAKSDINATTSSSEPIFGRSNPDDRKGGSDIQDIINGFVKLLNGNVQVQVNTNGPLSKPSFPSRTRINNRGPPRITDVPPIVFDPPVQVPPNNDPPPTPSPTVSQNNIHHTIGREPPPYPFDVPLSLPPQPSSILRPFVSGVPLPEQIVPTNSKKITNDSLTNEINSKESPKQEKEKPFNFTSSSYIEKLNRTQIKVTHNPASLPVSPTPTLPIENVDKLLNDTKNISKSNIKTEQNDTIIELKEYTKINQSSSSFNINNTKNFLSELEIKPTASSSVLSLVPSVSSLPKSELSDNFLPSTGVGTAVVVLEPSTQEVSSVHEAHKVITSTPVPTASTGIVSSSIRKRPGPPFLNGTSGYFPRPGIVLDDPEYKPGTHRRPSPIITSTPAKSSNNRDTFDVTVSAIQGPGAADNSSKTGHPYVYPVEIDVAQSDGIHNDISVITNPQSGQNFVSIDGKRTYLNLFDSSTTNAGQITPTLVKNYPGTPAGSYSVSSSTTKSTPTKSPPVWKKPTHPPVRIDTCIVGDDSTCDSSQHERCRTEAGVSSCHCRPGYTRRKHREPCHRVVSLFLSLRVDRMYDQHLLWNDKLTENDSIEYQQLEYEASKAIDSALSMTPFSDLFLGARVNNIYTSRNSNIGSPVFVNMTVQLAESPETLRAPVKQDLQKHLVGVIQRRSNNIGSSALWVDNPNGVVSQIHDVDECSNPDLNDCHPAGKCTNVFGSFHCTCPEGYRDPWVGNNHRSGRSCETCDAGYCNHRGDCSFHNSQPVCKCTGSYYGTQCEIDGEVLGVAIGSSLVAILIIITTLACLCAWSRRWNKEQKIGSPIFGYMPSGGSTVKTPVMGAPPYQVSLEDRLRWAQIADAMAHANHYGPEPVNGSTRPSSTIFGYTLPHSTGPVIMPRLRPPSVHTLRTPESSTSEEEDRADLLGRNFQVPRPKSRSSIANQSGIYYDVDYESQQQSGEIFSTIKSGQPTCIPLNTYTMGSRSHYFNFRS